MPRFAVADHSELGVDDHVEPLDTPHTTYSGYVTLAHVHVLSNTVHAESCARGVRAAACARCGEAHRALCYLVIKSGDELGGRPPMHFRFQIRGNIRYDRGDNQRTVLCYNYCLFTYLMHLLGA